MYADLANEVIVCWDAPCSGVALWKMEETVFISKRELSFIIWAFKTYFWKERLSHCWVSKSSRHQRNEKRNRQYSVKVGLERHYEACRLLYHALYHHT